MITHWSPEDNYVQSGLADGAFAHGAYLLIAAGPPRLAELGSANLEQIITSPTDSVQNIVYPIGLVQNFNLSQNAQFMRIFELGSQRAYIMSGRTVGQIGLGRVYYNGASLLRILYGYFQDNLGANKISAMWNTPATTLIANPHDVIVQPGYENLYINLASDMFSQPVGLMFYIRDSHGRTLGAQYAEHVVVPSHTIAVDAQGVMYQEQVGLQYERLVAIRATDVALVTGAAEYGGVPYAGGSAVIGGSIV